MAELFGRSSPDGQEKGSAQQQTYHEDRISLTQVEKNIEINRKLDNKARIRYILKVFKKSSF